MQQRYVCTWTDVAVALVKSRGLHEGRWMVGVQLAVDARNMSACGCPDSPLAPTHLARIAHVNLVEVGPEVPDNALVVDAARVNPRPRTDWDAAAREELGL